MDFNNISMHSIVGFARVDRDDDHWSGGSTTRTLVMPAHNVFLSSIFMLPLQAEE